MKSDQEILQKVNELFKQKDAIIANAKYLCKVTKSGSVVKYFDEETQEKLMKINDEIDHCIANQYIMENANANVF